MRTKIDLHYYDGRNEYKDSLAFYTVCAKTLIISTQWSIDVKYTMYWYKVFVFVDTYKYF